MRIASFTMIGQFPDGISLHVRNLRWALSEEDHIFIVTLPEYIKKFNLINTKNVTYIPFEGNGNLFIDFWGQFSSILNKLNISPEWFLFMEEDILFHRPLGSVPGNKLNIVNYLLPQTHYHATLKDGVLFHPRVWEGANLVSSEVVCSAIEKGIRFSFCKDYFCADDPSISLRDFGKPDTFDEFSLYCAVSAGTKAVYEDRAVHLRGPESLHRHFPSIYYGCSDADLLPAKKKLNYLCIYTAIAFYYIVGNWVNALDWSKIKNKAEFNKLVEFGLDWMNIGEYERLMKLI